MPWEITRRETYTGKTESGRPFSWDEIDLTGTLVDPTETQDIVVDAENFPSFAAVVSAEESISAVSVCVLRGTRVGVCATVAPWLDHKTRARNIAVLDPSSAADRHETSAGFEYRPLRVEMALGDELTACLGPDINGTGFITVGIVPLVFP